MDLLSYINKYFAGSQKRFADAQGVQTPQVTQWIRKGFVVVDHVLYSPRRELAREINNKALYGFQGATSKVAPTSHT